jgi:hypothetical protein
MVKLLWRGIGVCGWIRGGAGKVFPGVFALCLVARMVSRVPVWPHRYGLD